MMNFFSTNNMTLPPEGPRIVPSLIDLRSITEVKLDLTELVNSKYISYISGAFFDNLDNAQDVTLTVSGSNQRVLIPASKQLHIPLLSVNPPVFTFTQNATDDILRVFFANFPVFPYLSS